MTRSPHATDGLGRTTMLTHSAGKSPRKPIGVQLALALGALGVVFGDIGTSPLYALRESLLHLARAEEGADIRRLADAEVYGVLSLVFWAMTLVVSAKYLLLITRASNRGEGGIFALLSLVPRSL